MTLSPIADLSAPNPKRTDWIASVKYAHRGLHDKMSAGPVAENSLSAFAAAMAKGDGMECDVQLSKDGRALVFHDFTLERMTRAEGRVRDLSFAELSGLPLHGYDGELRRQNGTIPALEDLLALIDGRAPLLIELKSDEDTDIAAISRAVATALIGYRGEAAIMSFDARIPGWFAAHAPDIIRGLVASESGDENLGDRARHQAIKEARAEFLAWNIEDLPSDFVAPYADAGLPIVSWTVRSDAQWSRIDALGYAPIYER